MLIRYCRNGVVRRLLPVSVSGSKAGCCQCAIIMKLLRGIDIRALELLGRGSKVRVLITRTIYGELLI